MGDVLNVVRQSPSNSRFHATSCMPLVMLCSIIQSRLIHSFYFAVARYLASLRSHGGDADEIAVVVSYLQELGVEVPPQPQPQPQSSVGSADAPSSETTVEQDRSRASSVGAGVMSAEAADGAVEDERNNQGESEEDNDEVGGVVAVPEIAFGEALLDAPDSVIDSGFGGSSRRAPSRPSTSGDGSEMETIAELLQGNPPQDTTDNLVTPSAKRSSNTAPHPTLSRDTVASKEKSIAFDDVDAATERSSRSSGMEGLRERNEDPADRDDVVPADGGAGGGAVDPGVVAAKQKKRFSLFGRKKKSVAP